MNYTSTFGKKLQKLLYITGLRDFKKASLMDKFKQCRPKSIVVEVIYRQIEVTMGNTMTNVDTQDFT